MKTFTDLGLPAPLLQAVDLQYSQGCAAESSLDDRKHSGSDNHRYKSAECQLQAYCAFFSALQNKGMGYRKPSAVCPIEGKEFQGRCHKGIDNPALLVLCFPFVSKFGPVWHYIVYLCSNR